MDSFENNNDSLPVMTDYDRYLWCRAVHHKAYIRMGAHLSKFEGRKGVHFAVWAPNAAKVSVICELNNWKPDRNPLIFVNETGVWQGFIAGIKEGDLYKYAITTQNGTVMEKADPYSFATEQRHLYDSSEELKNKTASVVCELARFQWDDDAWMEERRQGDIRQKAMNVYECNLASWGRTEDNQWLTYRELAKKLVPYVKDMGYTHIELMPVTAHPFDGSWGYQVTGYFAPTGRFGKPEDFMYLVNEFHRNGIGVILDWVPAHFTNDYWALARFDGTCLYEHEDPRRGVRKEWGTYVFNYGRNEVRNFLISSGLFWLQCYHIDGLRVDAVASMLYLDYGCRDGEWLPNCYGGRENLEAIAFLREFNQAVVNECPGCFTCAEESTAWPRVTGSVAEGGLGFTFKWNMGWMHDTIDYFKKDPVYRKYHHNQLTFGMMYQYSENFILPLSHDEIVYGKGSLLRKMPGDEWRRFAGLRSLYGYMMAYPGKKLLFMGSEFAQWNEWNSNANLDWFLLKDPKHSNMQSWCRDLNYFYKEHKELWELDNQPSGFLWLQCDDSENSVVIFVRYPQGRKSMVMAVCNFTPVPREHYRIGIPYGASAWNLRLNSDDLRYGGSGYGIKEELRVEDVPFGQYNKSLEITIPPLAAVYYTSSLDDVRESSPAEYDHYDDKADEAKAKVKFDYEWK